MKILGVTRQWEGGGYYRIRQPLEELGLHGHEITCTRAKTDVSAEGYDMVAGHMIGGQNGWWRRLRRHAKLVYELDDDPFEVEPINPVYSVYSDPVAKDSLMHCIQAADMVTVSTPPLAERMRQYSPNVVVLQNRIDESMLTMERPRRDKLVIGWAGGQSHGRDIVECAWGLSKILDRNPNVEAHFIGSDFRFVINRDIRFSNWLTPTVDYYGLIDFDIGLAPLFETRFAETKSHIKALEYAALGIPVLASDSTPYRDFVVDGVTGYLIRHDHEWGRRLRELINDEAMREEMGAKARQLASEWTIQKGWSEWASAYKSIV